MALDKSGVCPFEDMCRNMPKGNFDGDHAKCEEANIEWTITDKPNKKCKEANVSAENASTETEPGKVLTEHQIAVAGADAIMAMASKNPAILLLHDEFTKLIAIVMAKLFKEDK